MRSADRSGVVREAAAAVGLAEGEAGVRAVLAALGRLEPASTRRISRVTALPVPIVAAVCGELRKRGVVADERPARLTRHGRALFASGGLRLERALTCPACGGREIVVPGRLSSAAGELAAAARSVPPPRLDLDQCHCTVETKLRRVLALHEADALVGRRLLLLGDDDLVSLTLRSIVGRFGSGSTIADLTVLDVDPALVGFLERELRAAPFPARVLLHDLREPLPAELERRSDTVVTDPPYTVAGARLFLSRAAEALDGEGDVFLSFGSRRPGAAFEIQQAIGELGFTIERLVRDFNEYVGAGVLGGTSHLYHLTLAAPRAPVDAGFYTSELCDRPLAGAA